jgi:hypothetical protein
VTLALTAAIIFFAHYRRRASRDPFAGRVIGTAPDPRAEYLPENRRISSAAAAELRRMVEG